MNVAIIGAGAVGTHLSRIFRSKGIKISQIVSRNEKIGKKLAIEVNATYSDSPDQLGSSVSHAFITVPDQFIQDVCRKIPRGNSALIHTSGSTGLDVISGFDRAFGVFYPLQSFSVNRYPDWNVIPIFIEASNERLMTDLSELASTIGCTVNQLNSDRRKILHLAAVFACNFSNYMFSIAQELVANAEQNSEILNPLIRETVEKAIELGAKHAQTGPAKREDFITIKKHLELLSFREEDRDIYNLLSDSIIRKYKE